MAVEMSRAVFMLLARPVVLVLGTGETAAEARKEVVGLLPSDPWYHYWRALGWLAAASVAFVLLMGSAVVATYLWESADPILAAPSWGLLVGALTLMVIYGLRAGYVSRSPGAAVGWRKLVLTDGPMDAAVFGVVALFCGLVWVL